MIAIVRRENTSPTERETTTHSTCLDRIASRLGKRRFKDQSFVISRLPESMALTPGICLFCSHSDCSLILPRGLELFTLYLF